MEEALKSRALWIVAILAACGDLESPNDPLLFEPTIPDEAATYRITTARLLDPHIYAEPFLLGCTDVTNRAPLGARSANDQIAEALGRDADGDDIVEVGVVLAVHDDIVYVANTSCRADDTCNRPDDAAAAPAHLVDADTPCWAPDEAHLSSADYRPPVSAVEGPCATVELDILPLRVGPTDVRFSPAVVSFRRADASLHGIIAGFVSEEEAQSARLRGRPLETFLPGGAGSCAPHDDRDFAPDGRRGWWFFLRFDASPATLTAPPPYVLSGGTGCSVVGGI